MEVVDDGQETQERLHFSKPEEVRRAFIHDRDMHLFQMIHNGRSGTFGDFHQNDDILVLVMHLAAGLRRGGNQGLDIPAGNFALGLQFIRVFFAFLYQEHINRPEVALGIAPKVVFGNIVHVCDPLVHGFCEHFIHGIHNAFTGTIVIHEENPALCCVSVIRIGSAFMLEQIRFCMAESVNGLLDVANHEELMPRACQGLDDGILNAGNVLAFVHINVLVFSQ